MQTAAEKRNSLLSRASSLKVIPTMSAILDRVVKIIGDKNSSFHDLTEVIKYDQAISSKIISIANSAYYSRGVEIFNLQRAMINIGFEEVKKIIMCLLFLDGMLKQLTLKDEDLFALWKHSVRVACAAKTLSTRTLIEDPQKAFTAGLLHDLGKIVFYLAEEGYPDLVGEASLKAKNLEDLEQGEYGIDHQEVGYVISVKWRFPQEFTHVMRYHHRNDVPEAQEPLVKLLGTADRYSLGLPADLGPEGLILLKEAEAIDREMSGIVDLLHLV
jgi:putative nucleotidyltransferase with HDIG domain